MNVRSQSKTKAPARYVRRKYPKAVCRKDFGKWYVFNGLNALPVAAGKSSRAGWLNAADHLARVGSLLP